MKVALSVYLTKPMDPGKSNIYPEDSMIPDFILMMMAGYSLLMAIMKYISRKLIQTLQPKVKMFLFIQVIYARGWRDPMYTKSMIIITFIAHMAVWMVSR